MARSPGFCGEATLAEGGPTRFSPALLSESQQILQLLQELTARQILKGADAKSRKRAEVLASEVLRFKGNVISFQTTSATTPGVKYWNQTVQLMSLRKQLDKMRAGKLTLTKAIRAAVKVGDVRVHCTCPAQKWWGWAYISTVRGYKYGRKQTIFPSIRNPRLRGTVCKHLINALSTLPFNVSGLAKRARKRGVGQSP